MQIHLWQTAYTIDTTSHLWRTLTDIKELKCDPLITSRPKHDNRVQGRKIKLAPEQRKQHDEPFVYVYGRPHTKGKEEKHTKMQEHLVTNHAKLHVIR